MKSSLLVLGACGVAICSQANAAFTLDNKTIRLDHYYPDTTTLLQSFGTAVVGAGVEFNNFGGGYLNVNISDTQITFTGKGNVTSYPATFNGAIFSVVNNDFIFTSLDLSSANTVIPFDSSRFWFDADHIYIDFERIPISSNPLTVITFNVGIAPVPEPSTLIAGIGALGMLAFFGRGSRK